MSSRNAPPTAAVASQAAARIESSKAFCHEIAAAAGVLSVVTLEAGWVVTEVGRQPWIVRNYMKVEDAATGNTGVWTEMSADVEAGLVYLPVETPTIDAYGGNRPGNNLFAESLVCLDSTTTTHLVKDPQTWHFIAFGDQ